MSHYREVGVLFVCLGNICRSPSAEGIFRHCVENSDLQLKVKIDSAGTANYHSGHPPDSRAIRVAASRGINLKNLRARQVRRSDFQQFDYIIAMDRHNYSDLISLAPQDHRCRIQLFLDFTDNWSEREIPDPYYGGPQGFERAFDMITDASKGLIKDIKNNFEMIE